MNLIDKIFKVGLLVVAFGFLGVYAYSRRQASHANQSLCGRYVVTVSANASVFHTVYEVDTENGTVYYAARNLLHLDEPIQWRVTNPLTPNK